MSASSTALAEAMACHRAGQLPRAEQLYRQVLQAEPNHAEAWHLLGMVAYQVGQHEAALECLRHAISLNPQVPAFYSDLGLVCQSLRELGDAITCYRRALELNPDYAVAHNNLGNALRQQGNLDEAVTSYRRAITLRPEFAEAHNNLGGVRKEQGQLADAVASYRQALELRPDYADAHHNLGNACQAQGQLEDAVAYYRRALELKPGSAETQFNLGTAREAQGEPDDAAACYRRALELRPNYAEAHYRLGLIWQAQGKFDEAAACYRRTLELQPDSAEKHNDLGNLLKCQGRLDEAAACYRRALALQPEYAPAHNNLGVVRQAQGQLAEAAACYRRALELQPNYAEAYNNLGTLQSGIEQAVACYERALALNPTHAEAHNNLAAARLAQARPDDAIACCRRALECHPDFAPAHSNLLAALQYREGVTLPELAEAHDEFERRHTARLRAEWQTLRNERDPERRLRLGFVSPDLGCHPVGYLVVQAVEHLDPRETEVVCYSDRTAQDNLTARFQSAAATWRDVVGWSDQRLVEQIRRDGIDILFDLSGHTARNRLFVFARKPAPLQITWLGYVGTTGLAAMDGILADRHEIPPEAEPFYRERPWRMPDAYVCYDPPEYAPPVSPLPARQAGHVTFGSFNRPAKITPQVVDVWSQILRRLPHARLVLKYNWFDDPVVAGRFTELFAAGGVDPARVEFLGPSPHADLLGEYGRIDLALDPFPYSGCLTTCEALWMGVPVITCPGETFASRQSLSFLSAAGLPETIARDLDQYVELAVDWAHDLSRLAALRADLRAQLAASPLCDGPRFAGHLVRLLRERWRVWCQTP